MGRKKTESFAAGMVPTDLSEAEQRIKATELAQVVQEIDKLRADAADAASSARKKIRALTSRQRVLAECVRTGTELVDAQEELFGGGKRKKKSPNGDLNVDA